MHHEMQLTNALVGVSTGGGSKRGQESPPQSEVCPSSTNLPNEIFDECNWTSGMKIYWLWLYGGLCQNCIFVHITISTDPISY